MAAVGIESLVAAAAAGRKILLLFDFDGTLCPTVSQPEQARLPTSMRGTLADLAAVGCQLGVISSRGLADLRARIDIPGVWLAGSGGLELSIREIPSAGQRMVVGATTIAAHARAVAPAIERLPGTWLERKPLGLTIHHRGASQDTVTAVRQLAVGIQTHATDVRVTMCSLGVEISPFPEVHKGTAVSEFIAAVGDELPGLMYAGNDQNDTEAMVEVTQRGGWAVAVGDAVHPAHTRVSTHRELRELLGTLVSALIRLPKGFGPSDSLR